jgi:hypothetical protein
MSLKPYGLDRIAQELVLVNRSLQAGEVAPKFRSQDAFREAYKMRTTVAYGLERFWGEHLRLGATTEAGRYWKDVWDAFATDILSPANIHLPNDPVIITPPPNHESKEQKNQREAENSNRIHAMADKLWTFAKDHPTDQRIALSVLTQLCDCLVWWTQRYKQD